MITKHIITNKSATGEIFGAEVLAQGPKNKTQTIFHILKMINDTGPEWYLNKKVSNQGVYKNPFGLISKTHIDIGNFKEQKENPMLVFEKFPEHFL